MLLRVWRKESPPPLLVECKLVGPLLGIYPEEMKTLIQKDTYIPTFTVALKWQSIPALLPGKFHGRKSLIGYSPWGRNESDTTERLHFHFTYNSQDMEATSVSINR